MAVLYTLQLSGNAPVPLSAGQPTTPGMPTGPFYRIDVYSAPQAQLLVSVAAAATPGFPRAQALPIVAGGQQATIYGAGQPIDPSQVYVSVPPPPALQPTTQALPIVVGDPSQVYVSVPPPPALQPTSFPVTVSFLMG